MQPEWVSRDDAPAERVAVVREELENLTRNEGKPEQAVPKIVEGRLNGYFKERGGALLEQPSIRDPKTTVQQVLGPAKVTRFARLAIDR
jgi:elongation factor Ts